MRKFLVRGGLGAARGSYRGRPGLLGADRVAGGGPGGRGGGSITGDGLVTGGGWG